MSASEEQKPTNSSTNAYLIPYKSNRRKSYQQQNQQRNNQSLPSIGIANTFPIKDQKVNTIRNQIDEKKNQITLLQARINALKFQKLKNEKKKNNAKKQIQFLSTVRHRVDSDRAYKQKIHQQKQKQKEELRRQAEMLREQLMKNKQMAQSILNEKKLEAAEEERMKKRQDEQLIQRVKSIQIAQNQLKAKNIKKEEMEIEEKNRIFYQSRVSFAKINHQQRVQKSLSERKKMERILSKLKKKQETMMEDCKKSEADMLSSLYELETLNPERKKIGLKTSRASTFSIKHSEMHE